MSDNTTWPFEEPTAINTRYVPDVALAFFNAAKCQGCMLGGRHSWNRRHTSIADVGVRLR